MMKKQKDPIQKFLRQVPPDFNKAEIHGVRLKDFTFKASQSSGEFRLEKHGL